MKNLITILQTAAKENTGIVNFWNIDQSYSTINYKTIYKKSLLLANGLKKRGVKKGDTVALCLPTGEDFYYAFWGAMLIGAIPAAIYPPVRLGKFDEWKKRTINMLEGIKCSCVLTDKIIIDFLSEVTKKAKVSKGLLTTKNLIQAIDDQDESLIDYNNIAFIQFTSGSTGLPKPILISHKSVIHNCNAIMKDLPKGRDAVGVSWLPLYHDMGLVGTFLCALITQGSLTLIRPEEFVARPKTWFEAITKMEATITVAPNFAFGLCNNKIREKDIKTFKLDNLKVMLCGAETVCHKILNEFSQKFGSTGLNPEVITPVYGLGEATLAVTFSKIVSSPQYTTFDSELLETSGIVKNNDVGVTLSSVGSPIEGMAIEIREENNEILTEGKLGKIWISGPSLMEGYLNFESNIVNGWFDTGDLGFLYNGELYLYGRSKDIIIIRGRNYDPSLIENALYGVSGIRKGCWIAFGVYDEKLGTEKLVVLVEKDNKQNDIKVKKDIQYKIQESNALQVNEIVLLQPSVLPRTSSGKMRRPEAKRMWLDSSIYKVKKYKSYQLILEKIKGRFLRP